MHWIGRTDAFSLLVLFMAEGAWALIRKTQSHIITLDETKEDNTVVRLEYFIIELNYSCLHITVHWHSVEEMPYLVKVSLEWMP